MNHNAKTKILLALDGSDQSMHCVNYVARTMPPSDTQVALLHVFNKIPESFWDVEVELESDLWMDKVMDLQHDHERTIKNVMQTARETLLEHDFRPQNIIEKIQNRTSGIARDIIAESGKGYHMLVMGRSGTSPLKNLTVGSVANKIIEKRHALPICVVSGNPEQQGIVIAMDGSEGSQRAVAFLCALGYARNRQVILFHAIRRMGFPEMSEQAAASFAGIERKILEETRKSIEPYLEIAREKLTATGFSVDNITLKFASGVASRAGALLTEAEKSLCGSIIVGRKGVSQVQDFNIGRVCHKLIQKAQNLAIWVVP
jgi:nucleotide-binding universal stress UspA family protein